MIIAANDVKTRGVSLFDEMFQKFDELIISVRGKKKYIVLDYDRYQDFRTYELEKAYNEAMEDYKNGNYKVLSAKEHIANLEKELDDV